MVKASSQIKKEVKLKKTYDFRPLEDLAEENDFEIINNMSGRNALAMLAKLL